MPRKGPKPSYQQIALHLINNTSPTDFIYTGDLSPESETLRVMSRRQPPISPRQVMKNLVRIWPRSRLYWTESIRRSSVFLNIEKVYSWKDHFLGDLIEENKQRENAEKAKGAGCPEKVKI